MVLDAGCGSGAGSLLLSERAKKLIAVDSDKEAIAHAKKNYIRKNLDFKLANILDLEEDTHFDVIVSLQVIEHMKNTDAYLLKLRRLLNPDGILILSTPNRLTQSYNENPYHFREYSVSEFKKLLGKYFHKVKLYGLHGNKVVKLHEKERKKRITRILALDKLKLRGLLPRSVRAYFFAVFAQIVRSKIDKTNKNKILLSPKSFLITDQTRGSIDLIAICFSKRN